MGKEIETKFYLANMIAFQAKLKQSGAEQIAPRVFEKNLRFDLPDGSLQKSYRVLRLRQDQKIKFTYKGPAEENSSASIRPEVEFEVSDFDKAKLFLESLGYMVCFIYEKHRTTYHFQGVEVVLDEMPYGNVCEIEGSDAESIKMAAEILGLDWEARCNDSYVKLFEQFKKNRGLNIPNLTFEDFKGIEASPEDLGMTPADK